MWIKKGVDLNIYHPDLLIMDIFSETDNRISEGSFERKKI